MVMVMGFMSRYCLVLLNPCQFGDDGSNHNEEYKSLELSLLQMFGWGISIYRVLGAVCAN